MATTKENMATTKNCKVSIHFWDEREVSMASAPGLKRMIPTTLTITLGGEAVQMDNNPKKKPGEEERMVH